MDKKHFLAAPLVDEAKSKYWPPQSLADTVGA